MKKYLCLIIAMLMMLTFVACAKEPDDGASGSDAASESESESNIEGNDPDPAEKTEVDLFLFAGGANMSGRGNGTEGVVCEEGHAYEFKAVSDPTKLYPMTADFGVAENREYKIDDGDSKTGGLVPAFCEEYYKATGTPVVAVSCSDGNNSSSHWTAGGGKLEDTIERLQTAQEWLNGSDTYKLRHTYLVWLQGEADGDANVTAAEYKKNVGIMSSSVQRFGVEQVFVIMIGKHTENTEGYRVIQDAQREMCDENGEMTLISDILPTLDIILRGGYLYTQDVYDALGADAGANAARYVASASDYLPPENKEFSGGGEGSYDGPVIELPIDSW